MRTDEALEVCLEFARAEEAGDPHAFHFAPQQYLLRSPGGAIETATFPWSETVLQDLAAMQRPALDRVCAQRLGDTLLRFLNQSGWKAHVDRIEAALARAQRVRITIRSAAAELYALPWELLYFKTSGRHLGELPGVVLRYEWPDTRTASPHPNPAEPYGRPLFVWSAAGGAVPAAAHLSALRDACRAGQYPFDETADVIANVSLQHLRERLVAPGPPVSVLHVLCHGGPQPEAPHSFALLIDDGAGNVAPLDGAALRQVLAPFSGTLRLVVLCVCHSGDAGAPDSRLSSVAQTLHRAGIPAVVASRRLFSTAASVTFSEIFYRQLLRNLSSLEDAFVAVRDHFICAGDVSWASLQLYARATDGPQHPFVFRPYRGLAAFAEADDRFYFGRQRDVARLCALLRSGRRWITVVGASGSGKSSLVLAGLLPAVRQDASLSSLRTHILRPSIAPDAALAAALRELRDASSGLLLIIDQFEEVFTHADGNEATTFLDALSAAAAKPDCRLHIVVTLRADFLGRCFEHPRLAEHIRESLEVILPLRVDDLRDVILRPAALCGLQLEEGLLDAILESLHEHDSTAAVAALPLLQFALEELWLRRRGDLLTWEAWRAIGGLRGAITRRAEQTLAAADDVEERQIVRRMFGRLVLLGEGTADTRRRATRDELLALHPTRLPQILQRWIAARLLTAEAEEISVAHEALLREWESLRSWIDEDREVLRLSQALHRSAKRWEAAGRSLDDLWRGVRLRRAIELRQAGQLIASPNEIAFLDAAAQEAERTRVIVEARQRQERDNDLRVAALPRGILTLLYGLMQACISALFWHLFPQMSHGLFAVMTIVTSAFGLIFATASKHFLITSTRINRHMADLVFVSPLIILLHHGLSSALGVGFHSALVVDFLLLGTTFIAGMLWFEQLLWLHGLWYFAAAIVATLRLEWAFCLWIIVQGLGAVDVAAILYTRVRGVSIAATKSDSKTDC